MEERLHNSINNNEESNEQLWAEFIAGNMLSFRKIYKFSYQSLYNYGIQYLSHEQTEDCIQNLFLYMLHHRNSIRQPDNVKSYLFISFRNRIFKFLRKNKKHVELINDELVYSDTEDDITDNIIPHLKKLLKRLSPREFQVVEMKYFQEFKNDEISLMLGIEYQTVRNTLSNAIKKMKKI
jgi:RNA polymerase sigma factor (sigma-70 family)